MRFFLLSIFLASFVASNAQTNYVIDYAYKNIKTGCNTFSDEIKVDEYTHQTTKGAPNFVGIPDYYVNLPCKRNSIVSQTGTEYQIIFPFKKNYKYQVTVYYKGTLSSPNINEPYPKLALMLNPTKKPKITSTACSGPQSIDGTNYLTAASGSGFAWPTSAIINTNALTQDYESLSIASIPWESPIATGLQSIQVRKIQITETAPIIIPPAPTTGFEGNFYKNINNGKQYIGMKGKYRLFNAGENQFGRFFDYPNITFISINSDPPSYLLGDLLASPINWLYDGEMWQHSTIFINDQWTNKKYFVEIKRTTYATDLQTVEFHCTDVTDPVKFNFYKFKVWSTTDIWDFNSTNGWKVEFDGLSHNLGGGANVYYIQSPNFP